VNLKSRTIICQLVILILFLLILQCSAKAKGYDITVIQPNYRSNSVPIYSRPQEISMEISDDVIEEKVEVSYFFGIPTSSEKANSLSTVINKSGLDKYAQTAAAKAAINAGADGIFITSQVKVSEGFIYTTDKYTIKGRPIKFKPIGAMSEKRYDIRRRYKRANPFADFLWGDDSLYGGDLDVGMFAPRPQGLSVGIGGGLNPDNADSFSALLNFGYFLSSGINFGFSGGAIPSPGRIYNYDYGSQFELGYLFKFGLNITGIIGYSISDESPYFGNSFGYVFKNGFNIRYYVIIGEFDPSLGLSFGTIL